MHSSQLIPKQNLALAKQNIHTQLNVELATHYPIYIGHYPAMRVGELILKHLQANCSQVVIVSNTTVAPLYMQAYIDALMHEAKQANKTLQISTYIMLDGEQYKNYDELGNLLSFLLEKRLNRHACLLALGGGVIGDITGFAASIYQRGIDFIQLPTTLLAMVDSSVGGKTAVNHAAGKNMIGAFWQPKAVISNLQTLQTLSSEHVSSGMAEIIKHGLALSLPYYQTVKNYLQTPCWQSLMHLIEGSCQLKAQVVAQDEKEQGMRAYLNLGHTFGHAIEIAKGYGFYSHGYAVAIGMYMAAFVSFAQKKLNLEQLNDIKQTLMAANLPISTDVETATLLSYMLLDKKNQAPEQQQITLILFETLGQVHKYSITAPALAILIEAFKQNS